MFRNRYRTQGIGIENLWTIPSPRTNPLIVFNHIKHEVPAGANRDVWQDLPIVHRSMCQYSQFFSWIGMLSHQLKQHVIDGEKTIIQNPTDQQRYKTNLNIEFLNVVKHLYPREHILWHLRATGLYILEQLVNKWLTISAVKAGIGILVLLKMASYLYDFCMAKFMGGFFCLKRSKQSHMKHINNNQ